MKDGLEKDGLIKGWIIDSSSSLGIAGLEI